MNPVRRRAAWLLGVAVILCFLAWSGALAQGPVVCPLRSSTGIPCAGCGMTRAACALAHGNVDAATRLNAASVPFALLAAVWMGALGAEIVAGRPRVSPLWTRWSAVVTWMVVVLTLSWGLSLAGHFGYSLLW